MTFLYSMANPYPQILNLQGTGLNAGEVFIGIAGQDPETNPKTVYWDPEGIIEAAQPISTSGGYLWRDGTPANIYLEGPFSIRVKDKNGAEVYYQAEVLDAVLNFISELQTAAGAGLVGFSHAETYPPGTLGAKGQEEAYLNDAPYYADPTGANDATAAIQDAINDGHTRIYGAPGATYLLNSAAGIQLAGLTGVKLIGNGAKLKIGTEATQTVTGGGKTQILMAASTDCSFEDWELDGNGKAVNFISYYNNDGCGFRDIEVYDCGQNAMIYCVGNTGTWTRGRIHAHDALTTPSGDPPRGLFFGNPQSGLMENDIDLDGLKVEDIAATGIVLVSNRGQVAKPYAARCGGAGIILSGANGMAANGITISDPITTDCAFHGIQSDVAYTSDLDLTRDISISNPYSARNGNAGYYLLNSQGWTITGGHGLDNVEGAVCDDRCYDLTITGTQFYDTRSGGARTQQRGIRIIGSAGSPRDIVIDAICRNNVTANIQLQANAGQTVKGVTLAGNYTGGGNYGALIAEVDAGSTSVTIDNFVATGNTSSDITAFTMDVQLGGSVRYVTSSGLGAYALTSGDTSPSVPGRTTWSYGGAAVNVTTLDDMPDGTVRKLFSNGSLTLTNGGNFYLKSGAASVNVPSNGWITLQRNGSTIYEIGRSF